MYVCKILCVGGVLKWTCCGVCVCMCVCVQDSGVGGVKWMCCGVCVCKVLRGGGGLEVHSVCVDCWCVRCVCVWGGGSEACALSACLY